MDFLITGACLEKSVPRQSVSDSYWRDLIIEEAVRSGLSELSLSPGLGPSLKRSIDREGQGKGEGKGHG